MKQDWKKKTNTTRTKLLTDDLPLFRPEQYMEQPDKSKNVSSLWSLIIPLDRDERIKFEELHRKFCESPGAFVITIDGVYKITLHGRDLLSVCEDGWLPDEIINAFVAIVSLKIKNIRTTNEIVDRSKISDLRTELVLDRIFKKASKTFFIATYMYIHIESSQFYSAAGNRNMKRKRFSDFNLLLFPINVDNTQCVLVAAFVDQSLLIFMDSLLSYSQNADPKLDAIESWLQHQFHKEPFGRKWKRVINPSFTAAQKDGNYCGIVVLWIGLYLQQGLRPDFRQEDIETLRKHIDLYLANKWNHF